MSENKSELYELSALLQRQSEIFESFADKSGTSVESGELFPVAQSEPEQVWEIIHVLNRQVRMLYKLNRSLLEEIIATSGEASANTDRLFNVIEIGNGLTEQIEPRIESQRNP